MSANETAGLDIEGLAAPNPYVAGPERSRRIEGFRKAAGNWKAVAFAPVNADWQRGTRSNARKRGCFMLDYFRSLNWRAFATAAVLIGATWFQYVLLSR